MKILKHHLSQRGLLILHHHLHAAVTSLGRLSRAPFSRFTSGALCSIKKFPYIRRWLA